MDLGRVEIPLVGGSYESICFDQNSQRAINLLVDIDQHGGMSQAMLFEMPGLLEFCDTGTAAVVRGLWGTDDYLYAVTGNHLWEIDAAGSATDRGAVCGQTVVPTPSPVSMTHNLTQLMVVDDGQADYYTFSTSAIATATGVPLGGPIDALDGYCIAPELTSGRKYHSNYEDFSTWDALDYGSSEGYPDDSMAVIVGQRNAWFLDKESMEIWRNAGTTNPFFARREGTFNMTGCGASYSVARTPNAIYWLSNSGQVIQGASYVPKIVSTGHIDEQIRAIGTISDARGGYIHHRGHDLYVLTFPTGNRTFVYDERTDGWSEWSSGVEGARHRGQCYAYFNKKYYCGDHTNGKVYEISPTTYTDDDEEIRRVRRLRIYEAQGRMLTIDNLIIAFESGTALASGQGSDPQCMFRYRTNEDRTWSAGIWRSIGKIGQYSHAVQIECLGSAESYHLEIAFSDPSPCRIIRAVADVEVSE